MTLWKKTVWGAVLILSRNKKPERFTQILSHLVTHNLSKRMSTHYMTHIDTPHNDLRSHSRKDQKDSNGIQWKNGQHKTSRQGNSWSREHGTRQRDLAQQHWLINTIRDKIVLDLCYSSHRPDILWEKKSHTTWAHYGTLIQHTRRCNRNTQGNATHGSKKQREREKTQVTYKHDTATGSMKRHNEAGLGNSEKRSVTSLRSKRTRKEKKCLTTHAERHTLAFALRAPKACLQG